MEITVSEQKERVLLSRNEIKAELSFTGAVPSKEKVKKEMASKLKIDEKLLVIKGIFTKFKSNTAKVIAYFYLSEEDMQKIEHKKKKVKAKPKEAE
ncbi:MAG: hypothetical protein ABIC04_04780 [Nanoarchaeota archaeon]